MSKIWIVVLGVIGALLLFIVLPILGSYNGLVTERETVRSSINNLQSQYQRRADLIPQLVNTVKGSANFEQQTLTQVVEARSKATSVKIDASNATPEQIQQYQSAQGELSSALSRLLAVVESYPDIKSTAAFQDLMSQLEGTENRIQVARSDYGKTVKDYNAKIQHFPTNITAAIFNFQEFPYFNADNGSDKAPTVDFGNNTPATQTPQPAQ